MSVLKHTLGEIARYQQSYKAPQKIKPLLIWPDSNSEQNQGGLSSPFHSITNSKFWKPEFMIWLRSRMSSLFKSPTSPILGNRSHSRWKTDWRRGGCGNSNPRLSISPEHLNQPEDSGLVVILVLVCFSNSLLPLQWRRRCWCWYAETPGPGGPQEDHRRQAGRPVRLQWRGRDSEIRDSSLPQNLWWNSSTGCST